jgi:general secretion pathway protein G
VSGRRAAGFTLLELLVVMAIIATLLAIASPRYFRSLERSRETVLRQDLATLRDVIDKYHGDTGKYPESLEALVKARYLRAVPVDPIAKTADAWAVVESEDPDDPGIVDVHSGAPGDGENGLPYAEW